MAFHSKRPTTEPTEDTCSLWAAYENQNLLTSAAKLQKIGTDSTKKKPIHSHHRRNSELIKCHELWSRFSSFYSLNKNCDATSEQICEGLSRPAESHDTNTHLCKVWQINFHLSKLNRLIQCITCYVHHLSSFRNQKMTDRHKKLLQNSQVWKHTQTLSIPP